MFTLDNIEEEKPEELVKSKIEFLQTFEQDILDMLLEIRTEFEIQSDSELEPEPTIIIPPKSTSKMFPNGRNAEDVLAGKKDYHQVTSDGVTLKWPALDREKQEHGQSHTSHSISRKQYSTQEEYGQAIKTSLDSRKRYVAERTCSHCGVDISVMPPHHGMCYDCYHL
jgi:hypothetical protein